MRERLGLAGNLRRFRRGEERREEKRRGESVYIYFLEVLQYLVNWPNFVILCEKKER